MCQAKPLAVDLYCGLGGWAEGFLAEGYDVVGFDIERRPYPGQLVLQDVLTLHGSQFRNAAVIVASPPCQAYSYRAMPWKRAKSLPPPDNALFEACWRIQREAMNAAAVRCGYCDAGRIGPPVYQSCEHCVRGQVYRQIPLIVENVKGAQPWVGRARWHYGPFYLWGDVPAIMPAGVSRKQPGSGRAWFTDNLSTGHYSSKSPERKAWSAQVAKIPPDLARHVAEVYKPRAA